MSDANVSTTFSNKDTKEKHNESPKLLNKKTVIANSSASSPKKSDGSPTLIDEGIEFFKAFNSQKKKEKMDFVKKALKRESPQKLSNKALLNIAKIEKRQNSLIPLPINDLVGQLIGEMYYDVLIVFFRIIEALQEKKLQYFPIFGYTACKDSRGRPRLRKIYDEKIKFMSSPDNSLLIASLDYLLRKQSKIKLNYSLTVECTNFLDRNEDYNFNVVYTYFGDLRKVVQVVKNLHKKIVYAPSTTSLHAYFSPFHCDAVRGVCVFGEDSLESLKLCKRYLKKPKDFYVKPNLKLSDLDK